MKVIIPIMAHNSIDSLFEYLALYSSRNAIQTTEEIYALIYNLSNMPYIGKPFAELPGKHFRELLYRKKRNVYKIIYFISEKTDELYVVHVSNCKQDFNHILKLHNYFNNFLEF